MKTITKSIALLFAAAAFTACTNESIEPIRPTTQSPATIIRLQENLDASPETNQPVKPRHRNVVVAVESTTETVQPTTIEEPHVIPTPQPKPRLTIVPAEQVEQEN